MLIILFLLLLMILKIRQLQKVKSIDNFLLQELRADNRVKNLEIHKLKIQRRKIMSHTLQVMTRRREEMNALKIELNKYIK